MFGGRNMKHRLIYFKQFEQPVPWFKSIWTLRELELFERFYTSLIAYSFETLAGAPGTDAG